MPISRSGSPRKAAKGRSSKKVVRFLHKPNCTTCRKTRTYLENHGLELQFRDLGKERLTPTELEKLIGTRHHTQFLNSRNETYRRNKMKDNPPSRREAIRLMASEPNLIRRPIVIAGASVVVGFDLEGMSHIL